MEVCARVWIEDDEAVWLSAVIEECLDGDFVRARLDDGSVITRPSSGVVNGKLEQIIHLRNDQDDFTTVPDLISLQYLHEPELLYAVCDRYAHDLIYTYIGEILLSFNPFQRLDIYSHKYVQTYAASSDQDMSLPPHVFAIAANAYKSLCDEKKNQSILVSGESGAGKTENTKFLMQYLTDVGAMDPTASTSPAKASMAKRGGRGKAAATPAPTGQIQTQILQTNPILEAFGNARTVRNDNSSRFGKFIELQFGSHHKIVGAKLSVYLLEKIRVSHQSDNERNFHIFYELCAGADDELATALSLLDAEDFDLLNESGCYTRRDGVDDAAQFQETSQAFTDMGILADEQRSIYGIVAALLHLGNVGLDGTTCEASNMEHASIDAESRHHLDTAAALLGVSSMELTQALVTRHVTTTKDKIMVKLSSAQAIEAKQSLTQSLFGGLFKWIVARLSGVIRHDAASVNTIGILDIFGFENLVTNGFEQLCINYANERLQAQFNDLVFAKEQRMYEAEGIEWKYIEYPDNAPCLQLLEDRPMGMWCLLDEEGMLPKGSNEGWIAKLYSQFLDDPADDTKAPTSRRQSCPEQGKGKPSTASSPSKPFRPFFATSTQRVEFQFVIGHFAGRVMYENDAYLQKNQDALPAEAIELCLSSTNDIVQSLLQVTGAAATGGAKRGAAAKARKPPVVSRQPSSLRSASVSSQFKTQLDDLIQVIASTQARYIRCVKPNDISTPRALNKARVVQQLRSGGVLEAVRIARAGYAVRVDHGSFMDAFGFFKPRTKSSVKKDIKGVCEQTVAAIMLKFYAKDAPAIVDIATAVVKGQTTKIDRRAFQEACGSVGFQLGNSKIFFRKDVYNDLRRFRRHTMAKQATLLQRNIRGLLARRQAASRRQAAAHLQTWMRACLAYRARVRASVLRLQTWARSRLAVARYARLWHAKDVLQRFGRHVVWTSRFHANVQKRVAARPVVQVPKPTKSRPPTRDKATPTKKKPVALPPPITTTNGRHHGHHDSNDDDDVHDETESNGGVLAALTLQNELLRQELDLLRKQTATQVQIQLSRVAQSPRAPSHPPPFEVYASHDPARNEHGYGLPPAAPTYYHPDQFTPPPAAAAPVLTELEFAHQQIISLSQQLLVTQIKYSNLLMDYNEHLCGYDADKPTLSDDAFAMVEALDIPCPATLECAQEQLRALLRKLHVAKEKLKHLETDMYGRFTSDSGFAAAAGLASMLLNNTGATKTSRGESIDTVEFMPRRSSEWRPHFDDNNNASTRQLNAMALPAIHDYDNDECLSEVDHMEYEQKVEELQRQVDMLRMTVMQKPRANNNNNGAIMAMTASTVSSSRSSIGSMTDGQLADLRRSFGYRPNTPRRLTYHVKDVTTWARDEKCFECKVEFGFFTRRHHCRMCSQSFCHEHSNRRARLVGVGSENEDEPVRVCDVCFVDICNESRRVEQHQVHVRHNQQRHSGAGATFPVY